MAPRIRYPAPDLNEWSKARYQIDTPHTGAEIRWDGRGVKDFIVRTIRFEDNAEHDDNWHFDRQLGNGAFGLVGLWVKTDAEGVSVDKLAVKEILFPKEINTYLLGDSGRKIPEEAIIQTSLQRKDCIPVVQMRGLNIINPLPWAQWEGKVRYYLEYCPYGDLESVRRQYWRLHEDDSECREQVPEQFLWQLLHNFAQVLVAMDNAPFYHPMEQSLGFKPYLLHLDIKTDNVMLAEPDDNDIIQGYPSSKVCDWGLAKLTSKDDWRNSWQFRHSGTNGWYPPEQVYTNTFGENWKQPPPWRVDMRPNGESTTQIYTSAHSVFALASVVIELMVLDHKLAMLVENANDNEDEVRTRGFSYVQSDDMNRNSFDRPITYSNSLKDIIAQCLRIDPALRPRPAQLLQLSRDSCNKIADEQLQRGCPFPPLHLADPSMQVVAKPEDPHAGVQW